MWFTVWGWAGLNLGHTTRGVHTCAWFVHGLTCRILWSLEKSKHNVRTISDVLQWLYGICCTCRIALVLLPAIWVVGECWAAFVGLWGHGKESHAHERWSSAAFPTIWWTDIGVPWLQKKINQYGSMYITKCPPLSQEWGSTSLITYASPIIKPALEP